MSTFLFRLAVEEQKAVMQSLQQDVKREKNQVKKLKNALDEERNKAKAKDRELESLRIKYEKALNSEMMLKMELEQKPNERVNQLMEIPCEAECAMQPQNDRGAAAPDSNGESTETTTFYTELTIRVSCSMTDVVLLFCKL